jgi:hypothetical protein
MRVILALLFALWSAAAAAQTVMYKCTDAQKRITYSNEACEKQGLKDAGPVVERVTTMPFTAPAKDAPLPTQKLKPPVEMPKDPEKNSK